MDYMEFCPFRLLDKDFDSYMKQFHSRHHFRPWYNYGCNAKEFGSTVEETKDKYKINVDVQHFRPNEINVNVTDKEILIEAKHEERPGEYGFISRHIKRRYPLPSNCPAENVYSTLSSDGVLTVVAEKMKKGNEKIVPIHISGSSPMKTNLKSSITQTSSTGITQKDIDDAIREAKELISMDKAKMFKEEHSCLLKPELLKDIASEVKEEIKEKLGISSGKEEKGQSNLKLSDFIDEIAQHSSSLTKESYGTKSTKETIREEKKSSYKSSMTSSMKASEYISAELSDAVENV